MRDPNKEQIIEQAIDDSEEPWTWFFEDLDNVEKKFHREDDHIEIHTWEWRGLQLRDRDYAPGGSVVTSDTAIEFGDAPDYKAIMDQLKKLGWL